MKATYPRRPSEKKIKETELLDNFSSKFLIYIRPKLWT